MSRATPRAVPLAAAALVALCCSSCNRGRPFYPVRGRVLVDGKPAEGVLVVLHPVDDPDPKPVQPTALVQADGSFVLKSYVIQERALKDGAPAGPYRVTFVWYPPDLEKYLSRDVLPDRLHGRYSDPKTSGLTVDVPEAPTELPTFELTARKK
jgi:hypothetical protein